MPAICFVLMIFIATTSALAGEGLLLQVPAPGTWVKYHRNQKNSKDGQVIADFSGTLTVRFLNEVSDKDVQCCWIEFDLEMTETNKNSRYREIIKYLVPVSSLKGETDPAPNVVRGWIKDDESETTPTGPLPDFLTATALSPPLADRKKRDVRRTFDYQRGQLISLEQVSGTTITNATNSPKVLIRHEINLQKDVPNGAAYGGAPAIPALEWHRQTIAISRLAKSKRGSNE